MKMLYCAALVAFSTAATVYAQDTETKPTQPKTITISESKTTPSAPVKASEKRGPVFRPTKDQIKQVQAMLKDRSLYKGEASGTYNTETRAAIRSFQKDNGLRETGTLNRATLEKMNVELTDNQKAIPVSESSFAADEPAKTEKTVKATVSGPSATAEPKPKKPAVFRATKDQIVEAQRILKTGAMYSGGETGKLDDATRDGLKKYQEANGLKVTGTLNRVTLEKMGVELTDSQKLSGEAQ